MKELFIYNCKAIFYFIQMLLFMVYKGLGRFSFYVILFL